MAGAADAREPIPPASPLLLARGVVGGALMGLANLVPGISGGTMLLACGVYPAFVAAVAEVTTLRWRPRALLLLGAIGSAAALVLFTLAGPTKDLVVGQRWVMYSLFVGLTLGGVPLVWRLARPATPGVWAGAAVAFGGMAAMATFAAPGAAGGAPTAPWLALGGAAGAGAMIVPGISGGYVLLLLGQYVVVLGALDELKRAVLGGLDLALLREALRVLLPFGVGLGAGVVGVSNLLGWLLRRFPKPTLGALLGLLLGAVVGLWPFQRGVPPREGEVIRGAIVAAGAAVDPDHWPLETFRPRAGQAAAAGGLVVAGILGTLLVGRLGREEDRPSSQTG